ncbi:hypothetical protein [Trueperella pyogenes]|uniref:hypothetical protein n=1 Tax=Trueperella pyogenes TaxID=1661 RepID=UPI00312BC79D
MTITISTALGALVTVLTAVITHSEWTSAQKRITALAFYVGLTVAVMMFRHYPATWQTAALWITAVVGAGQVVYTAFKPTGLLDWLEDFTTPRKDSPYGRSD